MSPWLAALAACWLARFCLREATMVVWSVKLLAMNEVTSEELDDLRGDMVVPTRPVTIEIV